ncbi:Bug family tripartite tricarboxylate transporter substrate binding protein [Noviherbaspirillum malthae]|uniref:Bug family tripartite tricarboxylate transporter substrate binding protein n=1 Tax=Noviherbaspirillum malthae TaxID=1260987 RepID=UPI001890100C|nr:tripartite tricarboxylate transporter substrate binding protein [Noviherbaspirillum malthae]
MSKPITFALHAVAAIVAFSAAVHARAEYPEKPIRIVVPSSPGGSADAIARMVGERLIRALGQTVIIENKGGGGGNIATEAVARSAPDGYTVLLTGNNHTLNVSLYAKPPYKLDDFQPVIELTRGPSVFVAAQNAPFKSLKEMTAAAKAKPDSVAFGSPGVGLPSHIAMETFTRTAQLKLVHVPYKGSGPSLSDVIGGQIPLVSSTLAAAMPHIKADKIKALAVTSPNRWPSLPDVPTVAESGYPGYSHMTWLGLLVPKGTPEAIVARLNAETDKVLADPAIRAKLEQQGTSPVGGSPAAFQKMMAEEYAASRTLVQTTGLRPE